MTDDTTSEERPRRRLPGGVTRVALLYQEAGDKRTEVDVRAVRVRDLREMRTEDLEAMSAADVYSWFARTFTDLQDDEIERLALEDLSAIREVVDDQVGKLTAG